MGSFSAKNTSEKFSRLGTFRSTSVHRNFLHFFLTRVEMKNSRFRFSRNFYEIIFPFLLKLNAKKLENDTNFHKSWRKMYWNFPEVYYKKAKFVSNMFREIGFREIFAQIFVFCGSFWSFYVWDRSKSAFATWNVSFFCQNLTNFRENLTKTERLRWFSRIWRKAFAFKPYSEPSSFSRGCAVNLDDLILFIFKFPS